MQPVARKSSPSQCSLIYHHYIWVLTIIWLSLFFLLMPSSLAAHLQFFQDSGWIEGEVTDPADVPVKLLAPPAAEDWQRRGLCFGHLLLGLVGLAAFSWIAEAQKGKQREQQQSRRALDDAESKFRLLVEQSLAGIYIIQDDRFLYVNPKFAEIFGYTPEEILSLPSMYYLVDEPDRPLMANNINKRLSGEVDSVRYTFRSRRRDGTLIYVEVHGTIAHKNHDPVIIGTLLDITPSIRAKELLQKAHDELEQRVNERTADLVRANELLTTEIAQRRKKEAALRESEEFTSTLLDNAPYPILVVNADGSINFVNPALDLLTGFTAQEVTGQRPPYPWWPPELSQDIGRDFQKALNEGAIKLEQLFQKKNGERFWVEITSKPIKTNGSMKYFLSNWVDVTERKDLERQTLSQRDLALALSATSDIQDALRLLVESTLSLTGLDNGGIYWVDKASGALDLAFCQGVAPDLIQSISHYDGNTPMAGLVKKGEPVFFAMYQLQGRKLSAPSKLFCQRLQSWALLPVTYRGESIACLNLGSQTLSEIPLTMQNTLEALVSQLGSTIVRIRAEENLRQANEELEERVELRTFELMQANEYLRRQIIERQQTEAALRHSEQKYRNIFDNAQAGIFRTRAHDGQVLESNHRLAEIFGYKSREEMIKNHKSSEHYVDPGVRQQVLAVLAQGETCNFETQMSREDGTHIWIACSARLFSEQGYVEGVINDITDRKRAEENLENIRQQQKAILDSIPDIAWLKDQDSRYIAINEAFARACGIKQEDVVGQSDLDIFPRELAQRYRADDRSVKNSGQRKRIEEPFADKEGRITWIETIKSPIYNEQGEVMGTAGIARDMTERKLNEAERMRLATAIEQADEGVIMADPEGSIIYVNPAFERIRGYSREEILGQNVIFLIDGRDKQRLSQQIWQTISQGNSNRLHVAGRKKDGALIESNISISPVRDEINNIINYVIVEHDLTEEIRLAGQLRQAQKMEAIGTLAGGIAHDFNNILSPIIINTEIALDDLPPESPVRDNLERVLRASERAAALVKQILSIGRRQKYARHHTQLDSLLAETVKFMRSSLPATIDIQVKLDENIGLAEVDPGQIQQVLLNLLINAAQAMPAKGGVLGISLENLDIDGEMNDQGISIPAGAYLRLSVSDTGSGMEPETLERIFEPYFTTKPPGKGTGLGLAVALSIIKAHDGFIAVESRPEVGTTFRLYLPRLEAKPWSSLPAAAPTLRGYESILLVDDEEEIVLGLTQGLQTLGYQVEGFTSSLAALERFRDHPDRFDLVITDQTMPGMTGEELSRALLTIKPQMPIMLCTGFSEVITPEMAKSLGIREVLMKPLSHYNLAEAIRRTVAGDLEGCRDNPRTR